MTYSVVILYDNGTSARLSVRGRTEWKTKRIACGHCNDMVTLIKKGRCFDRAVEAWVENELGEIVYQPMTRGRDNAN